MDSGTLMGLPRDIALLLLGAILGAVLGCGGSILMWRLQLCEDHRKKKAEYALRALYLSITSLTYLCSLLSAKTQGMKGFLNLPENPVDELMGIAILHVREIVPLASNFTTNNKHCLASA